MFDPKANRQPKANKQPKAPVASKTSSGKFELMLDGIPSDSKIRERACALYESRGREPSQDEQDWLRAEKELLK